MRERTTAVCWALGTILLASAAGAQEAKPIGSSADFGGARSAGPTPTAAEKAEIPLADADASEQDAAEEGAVASKQVSGEVAPATIPVCGLDSFSGIEESDARAATALICQELRRYGKLAEDNDGQLGPAAEGYRIRAYRLGARMLLELSYEKPLGAAQTVARVEFESVDEIVEKSTALVLAVKEGKSVPKTEPKAEPAPSVRQEPSVLMYAGIVGYVMVGDVTASAGGADLGLTVPVGNFTFTPYGRAAFGEASMGALGIDLRFYTSQADTSFFVGGGMSAMGFGVEGNGGGGPAGAVLLGVEFNREARSRVGLNARADIPAFTIDSGAYVVPVGINLYLTL